MKSINVLLEKMCPNGVEYIRIGDIVDYEQPSKYIVKSTDYSNDYTIPVLTAGQSFILGYTNEEDGHYYATTENPVIIFDDFTGAFKWVDFEFKVKSSAMKMLTTKDDTVMLRYVFHLMGKINLSSSEHKRLWIGTYSEIKVPVPPLEVQREIVRVLDFFTLLTAELTAELTARQKQYEYYRNKMLNGVDASMKYLKEITTSISSGKNKERLDDGKYPVYGSTGIISSTNNPVYEGRQILVARVGANAGYVHIADGQYDVSDNTLIVALKDDVLLEYIYYHFENMNLNQYARGGGQPLITGGQLKEMSIPVPSKEVQQHIVDVLNRFHVLCNDISSGIPAEINAREKQYAFYRDKILEL